MSPIISLEDHWTSKVLSSSEHASKQHLELFNDELSRKMHDVGDERIADLDHAGISLQIVSHNPSLSGLPLSLCKSANDELHAAVGKNPSRLAGFAVVPMQEPAAAAEELTRCVKELGFGGLMVANHEGGRYYDDSFFWPVFERAQELDVPVYFHPAWALGDAQDYYKGNYVAAEAGALAAFGWGWHQDVGLHILRLYASGLFDHFPKLKLVIGHDGEMLPFMVDRIDHMMHWQGKKRSFRSVWNENLWVTTSGMFTLPPLKILLAQKSVSHIMFSVDYPFEKNNEATAFLKTVKASGLVTDEEFEAISYRNAAKLFGIKI